MDRSELVERLKVQFAEALPLESGDPRYVDLTDPELSQPILEAIALRIDDAPRSGCHVQLVGGLPGSGKSTLFARLPDVLEHRGVRHLHVVRIDLSNVATHTLQVSVAQILAMIVLEFQFAYNRLIGVEDELHLPRPVSILYSDVLARCSTNYRVERAEPSGKDVLASWANGHGHLAKALRIMPPEDFAGTFMPAACECVRTIEAAFCERTRKEAVVLILDGLEKLRPEEHIPPTGFEAIRGLYLDWFPLFELTRHVIATTPPALFAGHLLDRYEGGEKHYVGMVRTRRRDGTEVGWAKEKLRAVVDSRLRAVDDSYLLHFVAEHSALVDEVISLTGGFLRDLLRLTRFCLIEVVRSEGGEQAVAAWETQLKVFRSELHGRLAPGDFDLLRKVRAASTGRHLASFTSDEYVRLWRPIRVGILLGYQNGERWFDTHPALEELLFGSESTAGLANEL